MTAATGLQPSLGMSPVGQLPCPICEETREAIKVESGPPSQPGKYSAIYCVRCVLGVVEMATGYKLLRAFDSWEGPRRFSEELGPATPSGTTKSRQKARERAGKKERKSDG